MAEAVMRFTVMNPHLCKSSLQTRLLDLNPTPSKSKPFQSCHLSSSSFSSSINGWHQVEDRRKKKRGCLVRMNGLPDLTLMAVLVEHVEGQRDLITHKSIWHLSDEAMKNVYTFYIMFTCWGCCFFGSTKDPYYDSEQYRKDGGDGTGHWVYEKQEDIEETARAGLWRDELIEEIEQKVGGLRELEEAREEELVK